MARFTMLDGATTIGGTKLLFEAGDTRLLFDFGLSYATMGAYFEEFLQPRRRLRPGHPARLHARCRPRH